MKTHRVLCEWIVETFGSVAAGAAALLERVD